MRWVESYENRMHVRMDAGASRPGRAAVLGEGASYDT